VVREEDGAPQYGLAMIEDISERKRAEEERHRLEAQLRQSQKMEAIGTLAGSIAHEFNNILAVIFPCTELGLQDLPPAHPVSAYFETILNAGKHAKDLVQQILAFSRQTNIQPQPMPFSQLVQEALRLIRVSLPATIMIQLKFGGRYKFGFCRSDPDAAGSDESLCQCRTCHAEDGWHIGNQRRYGRG